MKNEIVFDQGTLKEVERIKGQYPKGKQKSALIPVLHIAQKHTGGWLDTPVLDYVAQLLDIQPIEVYEVATFYSMFHLKPVGKTVLEICHTGPCMLKGSDRIIEYLEEKLEISVGENTPDGAFTLKTVECLGACGYAPMMQIGDAYIQYLTEEKIDEILELCRNNQALPYAE